MEFKNLFKNMYQGQYGLAIFSPKIGNVQLMFIYLLVFKIYLRIVTGTVWLDPYSPLQGFYPVFMKGSCFFLFQKSLRFKKFESETIWFELYGPLRKHCSVFIKNANSKVRSK